MQKDFGEKVFLLTFISRAIGALVWGRIGERRTGLVSGEILLGGLPTLDKGTPCHSRILVH